MNKLDRRNMIFFGLGTIGRDMFYAFEANALIYYLSNVLSLPLGVFLATSMVFTVLRVFDALNDPLMGLLVDNTRSRHGRFKPPCWWIILAPVTDALSPRWRWGPWRAVLATLSFLPILVCGIIGLWRCLPLPIFCGIFSMASMILHTGPCCPPFR